MTFSFILPAYKGRYLSEAIDSILAQDFYDFELIIVDDCSPDHLEDIVSKYNDPRITYYKNKENIGGKDLVAQWNHCLEYATGDYVILATDDDLYESNFLSSFVPLINKYPDVNLFRARILSVNSQNNIKWLDQCYKEYLTEVEFRYYMMHGIKGGIPQYIFKRKELVEEGGFINFPVAWGSDDATAMMMAKNGVVNSQEHLVRFRWSDINISGDSNNYSYEKLRARLQLCKWMYEHPVHYNMRQDWQLFYEKEISQYVSIYNKRTLIASVKGMPYKKKFGAYTIIHRSKLVSKKDFLSIIYHTI